MNTEKDDSYTSGFRLQFLQPRFWFWWLLLLLLWLYSFTPRWLRTQVANGLGTLAWRRNKRRAAIAQLNVDWCFPELSVAERQKMVQQNFQLTIRAMLDYGLLWFASRWRVRRNILIEGLEHIEAARSMGKNVILLTGHTIPLDFGAAILTTNVPVVGLIKETRNPLIDWMMTRGRIRFNCRLHQRDVVGMRPVIRDIKQGSVFYYLPDEDLTHIKGGDWLWADFFGVKTATITALGRLSRVSKAAILPAMTYFDPQRQKYLFRIHPALEAFPSGDDGRDTQRMNHILEEMIRVHPEQYMWTLRLFKTRPGGETPPYN